MDRRRVRRQNSYRPERQKTSSGVNKNSLTKKRTLLAILGGIFALALAIVLVAQFRVTNIQITGTSYASQLRTTTETALKNQLFGSNLVLLRSRGVKADIVATNGDQVAEVKVSKNYFSRELKITATDRQPAIQWQTNNKLYEVDQTGRITKQVTARNKLPFIIDETNVAVADLDQVTTPTFLGFIANVQSKLAQTTGLEPVRYRLRSTTKEVLVDTNKNFYVLFDTDANSSEQMQSVKRTLEVAKSKGQTPTSYIDVRIPYKAYYK